MPACASSVQRRIYVIEAVVEGYEWNSEVYLNTEIPLQHVSVNNVPLYVAAVDRGQQVMMVSFKVDSLPPSYCYLIFWQYDDSNLHNKIYSTIQSNCLFYCI